MVFNFNFTLIFTFFLCRFCLPQSSFFGKSSFLKMPELHLYLSTLILMFYFLLLLWVMTQNGKGAVA